VTLTAKGDRLVTEMTKSHLIELYKLAAVLDELIHGPSGRPAADHRM
jgi:hypothetical protein